ncbi:inhibitor of growth proteins N-terminal histone-binding-domain-containing protein [Kalaharituber pfeilii]|nr:inhibitor of growth proteins N-terminal histone-binding-domain-containing protein [Kalaharituber pfeilii]
MTEDVASVLEHFINDVANLPNEIAHIYEEIQAKDKLILELQKGIQQRDGSIQRNIKQYGSHVHYHKEEAFSAYIRKAYAQINTIQDEKIAFAQKALDLMDKHIKRLDVKIRTHSRTASRRVSPSIHVRSSSLALEKSSLSNACPAAVGTPGATGGHEHKRRRLASTSGVGGGVGAGTTGTGTSAVGSPNVSTSLANANAATPGPGSAGLSGRGSADSSRTDGAGAPTRTGPGMKRGGMKHGGGAGHKRRIQHEQEEDEEEEEEDDEDDEENGDDKRLYCYCQQVSWGNMVACDDSDCRYEWFHWGCVNLTKEPPGKWYCDTCRERREKKREK